MQRETIGRVKLPGKGKTVFLRAPSQERLIKICGNNITYIDKGQEPRVSSQKAQSFTITTITGAEEWFIEALILVCEICEGKEFNTIAKSIANVCE
jgi:hypothetical protein